MTKVLLAAGAALTALAPSVAAAPPSNGIVYPVTARGGNGLTAACTIVADRWTADYGPTTVYAAAVSPTGAVWTRVRCTVTKHGTTYVDTGQLADGSVAVIDGERNGTIPVAGIEVCVEAESQLTIDARPFTRACISG